MEKPKGPFDEPDPRRNLAIIVGKRKFYVPRETLATYSPVFMAMLYGDFKETSLIKLPGNNANAIEELLKCLIPTPVVKPIDFGNVDILVGFAYEYEIQELKNRCETFLLQAVNCCHRLLYVLRIASRYGLRNVLGSCVERCAIECSMNDLQQIFRHLRPEVIGALMLYKNVVRPDTKCKFEVKEPCPRRIKKGVYCGCRTIQCVYCRIKYCPSCQTVSPDIVCGKPIGADFERNRKSASDLLDRIDK